MSKKSKEFISRLSMRGVNFPTRVLNIIGDEFVKSRIDPENKGLYHQVLDRIPRPTPNCSICQWEGIEKALFPCFNICLAQGDRYIKRVYGNKICKRLFQEIKPVTNTEEK